MLKDLNDGLFAELNGPPAHHRSLSAHLQRNYVTLLMVSLRRDRGPGRGVEQYRRRQPRRRAACGARKPSRDLAYLSSPLADTAQQYKSAKGRPSEFRAALRRGVNDLAIKIDEAMAKVETRTPLPI